MSAAWARRSRYVPAQQRLIKDVRQLDIVFVRQIKFGQLLDVILPGTDARRQVASDAVTAGHILRVLDKNSQIARGR